MRAVIERALPLLAGPPEALHLRAGGRQGRPATVARCLHSPPPLGRPGNIDLREVPDPIAHHDEALVRVQAISLNRGETRRLGDMQDGDRVGWDLAGVIERAVGRRPRPGRREHEWSASCRRTPGPSSPRCRSNMLAPLRDDVSFEQAATLPVAGLTALRALDIIGPLVARRALVTGASGGVGRFAVQLAKMAGAHVTAVSANAERAKGLRELGADEVIHDLEPTGDEFDAIVEGVGGASLGAAIQRVAAAGHDRLVRVERPLPGLLPLARPLRPRLGREDRRHLRLRRGARQGRQPAEISTRLVQLVGEGRLDCSIDRVMPWTDAAQAVDALLDRTIAGKVVLTVG